MQLSIIVAMSREGVIGFKNSIPWHLSNDLKRFKNLTMGRYLLTGRKTFESIRAPLKGRTPIIITRQPKFRPPNVLVAKGLEEAMEIARPAGGAFVIGGSEIYKLALPLVKLMYVTWVEHKFVGDTFFPQWNIDEWETLSDENHPADLVNKYPATFSVYKRKI